MSFDLDRRPAIVSDADREWAMGKCPPWCRPGYPGDDAGDAPGAIVDDGAPLDLVQQADDDAAARYRIATDDDGNSYCVDAMPARRRAEAPSWGLYVDEQIEAFERFYVGKRDTADAWSKLFRGKWWSHAEPERRFPHSKPLTVPPGGYVFLRQGSALHAVALSFAPNPTVRRLWATHGVQFEARDPTLAEIKRAARMPTAA